MARGGGRPLGSSADAFRAELKTDGDLRLWELAGPDGAACLVLPECGSQLGALRLAPGGREAVDVLQAPDPGHLRQAGWGAGAPILFPFPGRIASGEYPYRGRTHRLRSDRGRHPLHGFVGLVPWEVVDSGSGAEGAWVCTAVGHAGLGLPPEAFPGDYRLEVTHRLGPAGYRHDIRLENVGREPFPFGYGWHPYFRTPLAAGGTRGDCVLTLDAAARWELTAELLPTGRRLEVGGPYDLRQGSALGEKSYDDPFTLVAPDARGGSHATLLDPGAGLRLTVSADAAFREWVVYSPRTLGAVAIEPYTCAPDAFNLEARGIPAGVRELAPGETWTAWIAVGLETLAPA